MKKKLLLMIMMIAIAVCLFAISISASPRSYTTFDVVLADGTQKTVYTPDTDQWQGRIYLTATLYAEAPLDTEGTYETVDWANVKVLDFSNSMIYLYESNKGAYKEMAYGSNQSNTAMYLMRNGVTDAMLSNVEKVITGKVVTIGGATLGGMTKLTDVVLSSNLKEIQFNCFQNCTALTTISFSETVNFTTLGQQAFIGCTGLKTVTLPNTITSMGSSVFQNCSNLQSVVWPSSYTSIPNSTFNGCKALVFEIPSYITSIGNSAFRDCDSLVSVTIPDCVTNLGSAFGYCDNLEKINISDNSLVSNKLIALAEYCPKLTSIRIPPLVTELGYDNFRGCTSLSEVIWPNNLTAITGNQNFTNCAFTSFTFPNSLTTLGGGNLTGNAIEELRLGNSLTNLDNSIFLFKTLKRVYIPASITTVGKQLLGWSNPADSSYNITFIFTGTMEQAISMRNTLESTQDTNHAPNNSKFYDAILVSASEYDVTQEPSGYHFVYGYSACDAFYNGNHTMSADYELAFVDFATPFNEVSVCTVCGENNKINEEDFAPIFVFVGYSVKENDATALCAGYTVNHASMAVYKKYNTNATLSYGIVASTPNADGSALLKSENGNVLAIKSTTVVANVDTIYAGYDFVLRGFNDDNKDIALVICSYIFDGTSIMYMTDACTATVPTAITYSEVLTKQGKEN